MKKLISILLTVFLLAGIAAFSFAEEDIPGTVDMPVAGMRFTPPEEYRNLKGVTVTDGAMLFYQDIYYAYWIYGAMTEDEMTALYENPESFTETPLCELFYLFAIGNGHDIDYLNSILADPLPEESFREIGKAGGWTYYLYMAEPYEEFADSIDPEYRDEYIRLTGMADQVAAAVTCYEPVDPNAALIGSKAEFTTTDLDGNPVSSEELFARNEITMVNIWATWCGPCIGELSELQQIHLRFREKDCGIVGLLDDSNLDSARELVSENGVEYPVILAPDNIYEVFPIEAYPSSFFVSREGIILAAPVVGAYVSEYENVLGTLLSSQEQ